MDKKIPCRVCGKLFKPCSYCQSHADTFRWRNFACSIECAKKYIEDTIKHRESLKSKNDLENSQDAIVTKTVVKKKRARKITKKEIIETE